MVLKNRGGRGKKNPWRTRAIRVPEPLLERFNQEIEEFLKNGGEIPNSPRCLLTREEAINLGNNLIKQRKSLKSALPTLINAIFGESPPAHKPLPCSLWRNKFMYVIFTVDGEILAYPILGWSTENGQPMVTLPQNEELFFDRDSNCWLWHQSVRPEPQLVEILEMAPDIRPYLPAYFEQWQSRRLSYPQNLS